MTFKPRRRLFIHVLRIVWILTVVFYEYVTFRVSVQSCRWPDDVIRGESQLEASPKHVLLVADPQIVDEHSYPRRSQLLSSLSRFIVDLNLRKSWGAALRKSPDVVVFLGDMMDGGRRNIPPERYENLINRFANIFTTPSDLPVYYIPGNHDIGIGPSLRIKQSPEAYDRYVKHFGPTNQVISIANHSLVLFDAPNYVKEDGLRFAMRKKFEDWSPMPDRSYEFVEKFGKVRKSDPVILFTHIPLYRPDGKDCGPLREKGMLRPGAGDGYQNTIEKGSSQRLLETFKPTAIFSGDDHDYCEYIHHVELGSGTPQPVTEISVKSISMTMGILQPGFQLLSLAPLELRDGSRPTSANRPCILPDQIQIYLGRYLTFFILSLLIVGVLNTELNRGGLKRRSSFSNVAQSGAYSSDEETGRSGLSYALPSPTVAAFRSSPSQKHPRGWFIPPADRSETPRSIMRRLAQNLRPKQPSITTHRRPRTSWLGRFLRDVRDVAWPTLGVFILVNWLVVNS